MIPVTFDITQSNVLEGETIKAYVQAVPRNGETVLLHLGGVGVTTQVLEVIHLPALNLNNFPSVSVRVKILSEE
ncbi:hypothetical protein G7B40_010270 [Aetokthonos hydrillicola Thurmond2011]|jgi:hypothetical protein|uniref:Uncharacterized protein n=1 Tax=Aetokthonos hydrillicola Thurmond2011 TaxID=2712845 RepID=A0AAP5M7C6_9CYAN|nr:hypothetical protein [Aetokthonos hydrillicola]MBO3458986.1 hypothetical protein [Aetokthonos hydrillicola CCALA 1050]MBW4589094.1 hypothetical protein [Aetokthonos hydrillicola CCALA 1050]MDR9894950.1 hypothetical protein [Aetokthonos hydrillicola Thurmond2011]